MPQKPRPAPRKPSISEILAKDPELVDCLFLVKHGVPFDVAFCLDSETRTAWVVVMGELEGLKFDWATRTWQAPS